MDIAPKALGDLYLQGGAALLCITLLTLALIATFKYIVKGLWEDNKSLRDQVLKMNERVVIMGEASRTTNETCSRAFVEQAQAFRDMASAWRTRTT